MGHLYHLAFFSFGCILTIHFHFQNKNGAFSVSSVISSNQSQYVRSSSRHTSWHISKILGPHTTPTPLFNRKSPLNTLRPHLTSTDPNTPTYCRSKNAGFQNMLVMNFSELFWDRELRKILACLLSYVFISMRTVSLPIPELYIYFIPMPPTTDNNQDADDHVEAYKSHDILKIFKRTKMDWENE